MNNKEMSWVPVLENIPEEVLPGDSNNYIPAQYETKDLYKGEYSLPSFDTKEECELWCFNKNYVGRWLKTLKLTHNEHNMPSLKPGDYIQIKEIVDGIGIGYVDDVKYLLFNTKHIDSWLSLWELMPEDFNPHVAPKVGDVTHKGVIDTIGNCANCGVEFHIHKDEPICNFPNCKCDVEVIPDGMSIKCSLTKTVQESYENKALKWYMSLDFTEQVELALNLIKGPTFNLTISQIMDAYEKYEANHVA